MRLAHALLGSVILVLNGCQVPLRVPLGVPLPPVGGARPATPGGIFAGASFGDGLWGQEQLRAEMAGYRAGLTAGDRVALEIFGQTTTRSVSDSLGGSESPPMTEGVAVTVRLIGFDDGRGALGMRLARSAADRSSDPLQDDQLVVLDLAIPLEYRPLSRDSIVDTRLSLHAGPRFVHQTFDQGALGPETRGTAFGGFLGVGGRWRYLSITGEAAVVRTPSLLVGGTASPPGWILLPSLDLTAVVPLW